MNHLALLVPSVEKAARVLNLATGIAVGPTELWEGEGTREIYMGDRAKQTGLLLLMEPAMPGAYERAMKKRGPGLHHIAVDVPDINAYLASAQIRESGWEIHPASSELLIKIKTAFLMRKGMPMFIEVQERAELPDLRAALVTQVEIPQMPSDAEKLLEALGLGKLVVRAQEGNELSITLGGKRVGFRDLV